MDEMMRNGIGTAPHNIEAEQSVLGAVLMEPSCMNDLVQWLKPECFFKPINSAIFAVMIQMFSTNQPIDIVSLLAACLQNEVFENERSGKEYLAQMAQTVPSIANLQSYADIVLDKYYLRSLITAADDILEAAGDRTTKSGELLDYAEQKIFDIRKGRDATGIRRVDEVLCTVFDRLQKMSGEDREQFTALSTGIGTLDHVITGLNKSDLVLVAARPGVGKTALAVNIASNVAKRSGKDVVLFNLEMSAEQVVLRMLSAESGIDSKILHSGMIRDKGDWVKLAEASASMSKMNFYVDDTATITVPQMKAKLRKMKNLGLVVVDYLGLVAPTTKSDNRVQQVSEITRQLKIMAKELNVPVMACAQLSRGPEGRTDKRPILSDLRESGSIEQDADIVMFIYRESSFNKEAADMNAAELIVAKNRHGETKTIPLFWDGVHTRYSAPSNLSE